MKYIFLALTIVSAAVLFFLLLGWIMSVTRYAVSWGVSFDSAYAASLGLRPEEVYTAMLDDLSPEHIRLSAKWSDIEAVQGVYDFTALDRLMDVAAEHGSQVTLVVGQKEPRWPECHVPAWTKGRLKDMEPEFLAFVEAVVNRYKTHPALSLWQVENEPFISFAFGECAEYDPSIIYQSLARVQVLDPSHRTMITDSGELNIWWKATRIGDIFGTSIYRNVRIPTGHKFSYAWLPPGLYKLRARLLGKPYEHFFVSELQAEPWFRGSATETPPSELEKTLNPDILKGNIAYAERVGASRVYVWGVEWWYYMKTVRGDGRYWEIVREKMSMSPEF